MPNYRVTHVSGLREKIIVARDEDQARELWGGDLRLIDAADRLGLTVESQIQALDHEQPVLPMMPGLPERRTHSYVRHGTTSLFAALDVASGFVIGKCYKRHGAVEFLKFLKEIDAQIPEGLDVHIIMDNYATHKTPKIKAWLARRPHYHVHFTPTSASWTSGDPRRFRSAWAASLWSTQKRVIDDPSPPPARPADGSRQHARAINNSHRHHAAFKMK